MPINFNKTFTKSNQQSHYYVFDFIFIDYDEAFDFCLKNSIPTEFIVKTKYYVQ